MHLYPIALMSKVLWEANYSHMKEWKMEPISDVGPCLSSWPRVAKSLLLFLSAIPLTCHLWSGINAINPGDLLMGFRGSMNSTICTLQFMYFSTYNRIQYNFQLKKSAKVLDSPSERHRSFVLFFFKPQLILLEQDVMSQVKTLKECSRKKHYHLIYYLEFAFIVFCPKTMK